MKYLSVCSGIEAATVAWHPLGWEPVAFSEIEAFPSAVLSHHYPDVPNLGDMTKFESWPEGTLASVDVVVGGPPCQAFSVAGLRRSLDDDRGNVTLAYVRMIEHIDAIRRANGRPPVVAVYENVPGLLSTKDNAFGCFIGALCGCDEAPATQSGKWPKAGLFGGEARRVGYRILDAQHFGVAQRRRRIFLVAVPCELVEHSGGRACPSEILALPESVSGNPAPSRKAWEGVARAATGSTARIGLGVFTKAKRAQSNTDDESWVPGEVAPTQNQFDIGDTRATTVVAFKESQSGTRLGSVHATLDANKGSRRVEGVCVSDHPTTADNTLGSEMHAASVRRLTPRECERLQGFPDDYTAITYRNKPACDGPRYKALGNSMAVPCMWWLGKRIAEATEGHYV